MNKWGLAEEGGALPRPTNLAGNTARFKTKFIHRIRCWMITGRGIAWTPSGYGPAAPPPMPGCQGGNNISQALRWF